MTNSANDTTTYLNHGIAAARAGNVQEARKNLGMVLQANPNHVPALFWLAFVAPSPQESIQLLERVLKLEPDSKRAKAGIEWARQRQQAEAADESAANDATHTIDRQQLFESNKAQNRAQKGLKAHRARRTINPLLGVLLLLGGVAMIVAGIWALAFVPPDTLAAWLPVAPELVKAPLDVEPESPAVPSPNGASKAVNVETPASPPSLVSMGDTVKIPVQMSQMPVQTLTVPDVPAFFAPSPKAAPVVVSGANPPDLFGPDEDALGGPRLFKAVDESLLPHQPASPTEKWIEVDVTKQRVTAWEGNVPVMTFLSSTGLPGTPTVLGEYNIYWKLESTLMVGPGYYLPEVPYTMYFYAGYALHGTYWHDNFGHPMSHGCVNLRNDNAKKLFEWAGPVIPPGQTQVTATADNPGTLVVVHD